MKCFIMFDYEVMLANSKLKNIIPLSKEKNQVTELSWDYSFYATHNPHATKRVRIILSEASLQQKLSRKCAM